MNLNTEQYFSETPLIHAPRSVFDRSFTHKTTMNVNELIPIFIDEALPGDSFKIMFQAFGRLVNPLVVPIMDELYFETLWFKCPMRLVWDNTFAFFGERENPDSSTDYIIPTINSGDDGFAVNSLADHFGLVPYISNLNVNALPFRVYNITYNQWLRDQNLIESVPVPKGDEDSLDNYKILKSAKMHDLFTSCLPTTQLGNAVNIPFGDTANVSVFGNGMTLGLVGPNSQFNGLAGGQSHGTTIYESLYGTPVGTVGSGSAYTSGQKSLGVTSDPSKSGLIGTADLTSATGINVNDLRFLIKLQQYREKMLTGGHRYREIVSQFFNVDQLDNRAYTVEFLGSTREMIDINTVVQTSSTDTTSPLGNLSSYGVVNSFDSVVSTSFVEHSYIMGLARIRHNPVYQQGINKLWKRSTQLDFYNPMFNGLGEQPVYNYQIMVQGDSVLDENGDPVDEKTFGFNEAWYDYRFYPSLITGQLRSGIEQSLDIYHLAQYFGTYDASTGKYTPVLPLLNQSFIEENIPIDRALSISSEDANIPQFVMDFRFHYHCARVMPVRNIPAGLYGGI